MNKSLNPSQVGGQQLRRYKNTSRQFDETVFKVQDPPCPCCRNEMDFMVIENYEGTGTDWIQWRCKSQCGYYKNIEIV